MKWNEMDKLERDKLVAIKVMDRPALCNGALSVKRWDTGSRAGGIAFTYYTYQCVLCGHTGSSAAPPDNDTHRNDQDIPPYSTSMDAAWQVFRRMAEQFDYKTWNPLISELLGAEDGELYPAGKYMAEVVKWTPEKICLAALHAVGVEIDE